MNLKGHVVDYVDDYLHGALLPHDAAYVESHCDHCRICQLALEEARGRFEAVQSVPMIEASDDLIQSTLQRVQTAAARRRRARRIVGYSWLTATAAAVLILGGLHLYYVNLRPSAYDLQLYGQKTLFLDTPGSLRVRLFDRERKRAVAGVPVEIDLLNRTTGSVVRLAAFSTGVDGSGSPRFRLPDVPAGQYDLRVRARTPGRDESLTRPVELTRAWKLMLSTDKPVYQPGQTIHMRSLALRRPDLLPVAGENAVFSITDPRGNVIFKQREPTSAYGIAAADCPLAVEITQGTYIVACAIGDTESRVAVEIKHYVLPKFRVDVDLDRTFYRPAQTVRGAISANYFFGQPVAAADVEVTVSTTDVAPHELARLAARTDADGNAEFTFRLPDALIGREQNSGDATVSFAVLVRDPAGQEQRRAASCPVTVNPIRVEIIPESGTLVPGVANTVYVFATYADGRPARARLAVTGLQHELATSELGAASFEITPNSNQVFLSLRATDDDGLVGRREVALDVGMPGRDFLVRTDHAVYRGGDTMNLLALGGGVEPVFIDFIKDGQTILTRTIDLRDGRGDAAFDLPAELSGTIEILAYRFGEAGLPVRKRRIIYVEPASELHLAAELDRAEYRPGERARLVLSLTDDAGRPTPGAVSLAAVDEAVFSVLDQAPGMERTFFGLEQELLQPIYAIYNWTPNFETSAFDPVDRNVFEQALFCRTARNLPGAAVFDELLSRGEISPRVLEVLNSPDLDRMLDEGWVSPTLANVLRQTDRAHSLAATSYPGKIQQVRIARSQTLRLLKSAWLALALIVGAISIVVLIILIPRITLVLLFFVALPLVGYMMLPSLSRARESASGSFARSSLRGIDAALQSTEIKEPGRPTRPGDEQLSAAAPRVRQWFPETLLWRPEVITDDAGRITLDVDLADSITTWRLTGSAVAADGRLGALDAPVRVFQPFFVDLNLPVALTRHDEIALPVVVYNYLDAPQTVELSLDTAADWFDLLDPPDRSLDLAPGEVRSTSFTIRATRVGTHTLQVSARAGAVADAVKREVAVVPDGREVAHVFNGTLTQPAGLSLVVPPDAIDGSARAVLKLYPSTFSQVLEGLDGIFQRPYGCFEQTSSTTYPNVLALDYLRRTQQNAPDVEATARQYIHLGYQRLLGFEVDGGGFDWFGRPPANLTLTAYGLMEFTDMARVHDVDPRLIERTRNWLLTRRNRDGSWSPESHRMHVDPTSAGDDARLTTTAYVAWAVYGADAENTSATPTRNFLLAHPPETLADPYVIALVANALLAIDDDDITARPYLNRLHAFKHADDNAKVIWWERGPGTRTTFHGTGHSGNIETTALVTLALLESGQYSSTASAALNWLVAQKDRLGTFQTTQATILAFKALLAAAGRPLGADAPRIIDVTLNDAPPRRILIPADQADVMQQLSLSADLRPGANALALAEPAATGLAYQVDFSCFVPHYAQPIESAPLDIDLAWDRTEIAVGDTVAVTATVRNNTAQPMPMIILDLPIPAGFAADAASFDALLPAAIAKYQITPRSIVVYLRELPPNRPLVLNYRLIATMPVRVTAPAARAYEYYDPDTSATGRPATLVVTSRA